MQNITLEQVAIGLTLLITISAGGYKIYNSFKDTIEKFITETTAPILKKLTDMDKKIDKVDMQGCKNFLVRTLADIDRNGTMSDPEMQRFWEEYEHYLNLKGNSYISEWVNRLKKEGKL